MDRITALQQLLDSMTENITQAQLVAADPSTEPELLRELALSTDQKIRQAVAGNPNTPVDVLLKLGAEFPSQFLDNPVFQLLLLENPNLVAEIPSPSLQSILRQENVPVYILEQAADRADLEVQLALVKNIQTPKSVLNRLTQSRNREVVESAHLHINFAGELTGTYEQKFREVIQAMILPANYNSNALFFALMAPICTIPKYIVEHWVSDSSYHNLLRELACSPATSTSILKHLANHIDDDIRTKAAQNPNTPTETLRKLASEDQTEQTRISVARNLSTPSDALEKLSKYQGQTVRINVALNPNTPLTVLKNLANDIDKDVADAARVIGEQQGEYTVEAVITNPKIPPSVLEKLAQTDPSTVCKHPNTPPKLLLKFSKSVSLELREGVAQNPNVPASILGQLAHDDSSQVRWEVARNPNTPINILFKQLARDAWVSQAIAEQMSSQKLSEYPEKESILNILAEESTSTLETILQRLAQDGGEAARLFLARRFDLPGDLLSQLAESNEVKVREAVAQNLNTPTSCLEQLAQSPEAEVCQAVAQNPNTPIRVLEKLARNQDSRIRKHIASKINLSPQMLAKLAIDPCLAVREKAMMNPALPEEFVKRIICGRYTAEYLKLNPDFLSRHPDIKLFLINSYAKSIDPWVSFIGLSQPEISQDLLQEKSISTSWLERLAVAQNPQAAQNILNKLAEDSNQLVRAAAKDTLQHLS